MFIKFSCIYFLSEGIQWHINYKSKTNEKMSYKPTPTNNY